ncbi:hypothetical protein HMPREF1484_02021 [Dermabacter sp. HFH0086]|uniref:hypothetical protein n=1 Tax=Dermabacter TaxID=36739 RepID=UPI000353E5F8|nr:MULTISPECIES: hypothetical protein [Dermabacter]EPH14712.1 hypothetical protein HMPREF1484_02021 [Dermabacter sp. HFH0086]
MRQSFTVDIPQGLVVTSNANAHKWRRHRTREWWRDVVPDLVPMGRANVYVGITKRTRGKYDPANLTDTFKGCVDQLVENGVLEDDDYTHVTGPLVYHEAVDREVPVETIRARVTLTPYASILEEGDCE